MADNSRWLHGPCMLSPRICRQGPWQENHRKGRRCSFCSVVKFLPSQEHPTVLRRNCSCMSWLIPWRSDQPYSAHWALLTTSPSLRQDSAGLPGVHRRSESYWPQMHPLALSRLSIVVRPPFSALAKPINFLMGFIFSYWISESKILRHGIW